MFAIHGPEPASAIQWNETHLPPPMFRGLIAIGSIGPADG